MKMKPLVRAAAIGTAAYAAVSGILFYEVFNRNATIPNKIFQKKHAPKMNGGAEQQADPRPDWTKAQPFEEWTLQNADGQTLKAFYLSAETDTGKYAVCSHGYRSNGKREFRYLTKYYHDHGFHVLLVDHRASGESEGAWITFGVKESEDLMLWIRKIRDEHASAQIVLHGVSMGAATVLMLSDNPELLPNVKYIVSDCSFTGATDQFVSVLQNAKIPPKALIAGANVFNRLVSGFSLFDAKPIDHVRNALVPILFVHGKADDFVPPIMGQENYDACTSPKDLLLVDDAVHAQSYPKDSAAYDAKMDAFAAQYLTESTADCV